AKGKNVSAIIQESRSVGTDQASGDSEGLDYYVLGPKGGKTSGAYNGKVPAIINQRNMPGVIMENYMRAAADYKATYPYVDAIALGYCNGIAKFLDSKSCVQSGISSSGGVNTTVSCPIPNGKILTHSYQADAKNGHCGATYPFQCNCGNAGRR